MWSAKPSRGPTRGGTSVTVRGVEGALEYDGVVCMFGAEAVSGVVSEDGSVICLSPSVAKSGFD